MLTPTRILRLALVAAAVLLVAPLSARADYIAIDAAGDEALLAAAVVEHSASGTASDDHEDVRKSQRQLLLWLLDGEERMLGQVPGRSGGMSGGSVDAPSASAPALVSEAKPLTLSGPRERLDVRDARVRSEFIPFGVFRPPRVG